MGFLANVVLKESSVSKLATTAVTTDTSTGIFVTATTTNNITDYAVGLLITGDDI